MKFASCCTNDDPCSNYIYQCDTCKLTVCQTHTKTLPKRNTYFCPDCFHKVQFHGCEPPGKDCDVCVLSCSICEINVCVKHTIYKTIPCTPWSDYAMVCHHCPKCNTMFEVI